MGPSASRPSPELVVDLLSERLLRDGEPVALRPKTWTVLRHLMEHPGALVSREDLLAAAWPGSVISEGILNKSIGELRGALGDDRDSPRFIETVPRRGFRWIGAEAIRVEAADGKRRPAATPSPIASPLPDQPSGDDALAAVAPLPAEDAAVVGLDRDLDTLERCFARATAGTRQVVFVTGEAGAGKSTLVETFLARIERGREAPRIAHSQCVEAWGQHEPYRPLLEAAERLALRGDDGEKVAATLRTSAPNWARQMPSLGEMPAPPDEDAGLTPARMLREIAAALEDLAAERPLVLLLEDAHWADLATTDACNLVARRRDRARLMLLVTMRPADALVSRHPVLAAKTELVSRTLASEIAVTPFTPARVQDYLARRCGGLALDPELAAWIHHQTAGNPLFVRIVVDDLVHRGILAMDRDGNWSMHGTAGELREFVPDSLRELVERQVERLAGAERNVIEAASVLGAEFEAATVAGVSGLSVDDTENACEALARRGQFLGPAGRGRSTGDGRFAFVHSLVQRILHDRLPASRMRRLHLAAAAGIEREQGGRGDAVALQLALHYAMAGDPSKALPQLQRAADSIRRIPAPREVIEIREQILDLVERSPDLPGHRRELIVATMNLAEARQLAFAVCDAETTALCERVLELATSAEDGREAFLATMGLFSNRFYTGRYEEARDMGRRLLMAAEMAGHPFMKKSAHFAIAGTSFRLADFDEAAEHFEACLEHEAQSSQTYGWDFHLMSMSHLALVAAHRGNTDDARRLVREAEAHGSRGGKSPDAAAIPMLAYVLALTGDDDGAMPLVLRALEQSERIGAAAWIERARFLHGLVLSRRDGQVDGIRQMKDSLDRQLRNNVWIDRTVYSALLAGEMIRRGIGDARPVLDEAIAYMERSGERHFEPELRRLREAVS